MITQVGPVVTVGLQRQMFASAPNASVPSWFQSATPVCRLAPADRYSTSTSMLTSPIVVDFSCLYTCCGVDDTRMCWEVVDSQVAQCALSFPLYHVYLRTVHTTNSISTLNMLITSSENRNTLSPPSTPDFVTFWKQFYFWCSGQGLLEDNMAAQADSPQLRITVEFS